MDNKFNRGVFSARSCAISPAGNLALAGLCAWLISPVSVASVRQPVVAGSFYPANPDKLAGVIDADLANAADAHLRNIRAIIVPHAGYPFSGPVAASAFRQLKGLHFKTVIVMGPSHFVATSSASISSADVFRTPLGDRQFVDAVLKMDFGAAARGEACGRVPILILMYIAKARGWTPHLLDSRNSGDTYGVHK